MANGYKTGGRKPGTLNKDNPFKPLLREHSAEYVTRNITLDKKLVAMLNRVHAARIEEGLMPELDLDMLVYLLGRDAGQLVSRLDIDAALAGIGDPAKRIDAEAKLANYHSAKMKESTLELDLGQENQISIETRLATLAGTATTQS